MTNENELESEEIWIAFIYLLDLLDRLMEGNESEDEEPTHENPPSK